MTEHKFTDEEIIKALEHCESGCSSEACIGCPFDEKGACTEAENALAIFALDLIKRQKAEVAREIFERVDSLLDLICHMTGIEIINFTQYTELKKKYTEGKKGD